MVHVGLATAFRNPDIELADSEGERLSGAMQKVMRHYDLPEIASETKDWIGLIICCGAIYGPRFTASAMDRKMKAEAAQAERDGSNVVEMTVVN